MFKYLGYVLTPRENKDNNTTNFVQNRNLFTILPRSYFKPYAFELGDRIDGICHQKYNCHCIMR